jgi:hypothetical protein
LLSVLPFGLLLPKADIPDFKFINFLRTLLQFFMFVSFLSDEDPFDFDAPLKVLTP